MNILAHMSNNPDNEYCMEVTDKTRADVKVISMSLNQVIIVDFRVVR
jgi:UDP-N-acetylglucosamine pyrophosphorylase